MLYEQQSGYFPQKCSYNMQSSHNSSMGSDINIFAVTMKTTWVISLKFGIQLFGQWPGMMRPQYQVGNNRWKISEYPPFNPNTFSLSSLSSLSHLKLATQKGMATPRIEPRKAASQVWLRIGGQGIGVWGEALHLWHFRLRPIFTFSTAVFYEI